MADKSQRNQFKKKVTTCPLLLSLFLLGTTSAEHNVKVVEGAAFFGTASTSVFADSTTSTAIKALNDGAAVTPITRASCLTACETDIKGGALGTEKPHAYC